METKNVFIVLGIILFCAGLLFKLLRMEPFSTKPISYITIANTLLIISLILSQKKE